MIDLGISKLALIAVVALVVIGPERLPRVARTAGMLLGKAQRYVADVKAEVARSMELDELRKMKESVESAARDVEKSVNDAANDVRTELDSIDKSLNGSDWSNTSGSTMSSSADWTNPPVYKAPKKNWRIKRTAMPRWYKSQHNVKSHVQSGAARVARHRPKKRIG